MDCHPGDRIIVGKSPKVKWKGNPQAHAGRKGTLHYIPANLISYRTWWYVLLDGDTELTRLPETLLEPIGVLDRVSDAIG